jgi:hypothetical protein
MARSVLARSVDCGFPPLCCSHTEDANATMDFTAHLDVNNFCTHYRMRGALRQSCCGPASRLRVRQRRPSQQSASSPVPPHARSSSAHATAQHLPASLCWQQLRQRSLSQQDGSQAYQTDAAHNSSSSQTLCVHCYHTHTTKSRTAASYRMAGP